MSSTATPKRLVVGVDVGGTKTDAIVLDEQGEILERFRAPTGFGPEAVVRTARQAVTVLAEAIGITPSDFASIGVGIPGRVDSPTGVVAHAVNLGLEGLELGAVLQDAFGIAVRVENDVNAAAVGAFHLLELEPSSSMAYLNLGTGLAAGLVLEGELRRGFGGSAGEIGHIPIDPSGPICACGQRGCLELFASGSGVARMWPTSSERPIHDLFEAARSGHADAVAVTQKLVEGIAAAVRILVLSDDVDLVVIGGGLTSVGQPLLDGVREVLARWAADSPFIASLDLQGRVRLLDSDHAAGSNADSDLPDRPVAALGAAYLGRG
jgi:predicted NBD/HSP70 family sugar kinase